MRERGASIRVRSDRASDEVARVVDLFHLNRFGSYYTPNFNNVVIEKKKQKAKKPNRNKLAK